MFQPGLLSYFCHISRKSSKAPVAFGFGGKSRQKQDLTAISWLLIPLDPPNKEVAWLPLDIRQIWIDIRGLGSFFDLMIACLGSFPHKQRQFGPFQRRYMVFPVDNAEARTALLDLSRRRPLPLPQHLIYSQIRINKPIYTDFYLFSRNQTIFAN